MGPVENEVLWWRAKLVGVEIRSLPPFRQKEVERMGHGSFVVRRIPCDAMTRHRGPIGLLRMTIMFIQRT
jgi:hypothetical protein